MRDDHKEKGLYDSKEFCIAGKGCNHMLNKMNKSRAKSFVKKVSNINRSIKRRKGKS